MEKKVTNDAAAYIRSLAQKYGRNADWGEDAVRNAVSVTENEALELNVIDLIADNVPDLLEKIDGREIELPLTTKKLRTADAVIEEIELGLRFKILGFISDPNIAYLLMLAGMYGFDLSRRHWQYLPDSRVLRAADAAGELRGPAAYSSFGYPFYHGDKDRELRIIVNWGCCHLCSRLDNAF